MAETKWKAIEMQFNEMRMVAQREGRVVAISAPCTGGNHGRCDHTTAIHKACDCVCHAPARSNA